MPLSAPQIEPCQAQAGISASSGNRQTARSPGNARIRLDSIVSFPSAPVVSDFSVFSGSVQGSFRLLAHHRFRTNE
jgi:hypothetical protein